MAYKHPPLNPIRVFETAARLMSFTAAAEELNVSQVAVSRQIKVLEEYLGTPLFLRSHRSIKLTEDGARIFPAVNRALDDINHAVSTISTRGERNALTIQTHTTFGQRWLIPRLFRFHERFKNINIRLTSSIHPFNPDRQNIQAAIQSGEGSSESCDCDFIAPIELIPVCSPSLIESTNDRDHPNSLSQHTLLHSFARPRDWAAWFVSRGLINIDPDRGLKFENSVLAYEAALQGMGVAIGVHILVEQYLRVGSLIAPFGPAVPLNSGYYLLTPRGRPTSPMLRNFRNWLIEEGNRARIITAENE
jgi:LysR family transcriptional regulator, glycine cleavage system transcriptional activator